MIQLLLLLFFQASAKEAAQPVSVSYENLIRCYPELTNTKLSFKVDLNRLKEFADKKFATTATTLRRREIVYKDAADQTKRLIYSRRGLSKDYDLRLEKIDEKGEWVESPLPQAQRINPNQKEIGNIMQNSTVTSEDTSYDLAKIHGMQLSYRSHFDDILSLELSDQLHQRTLSCENQKGLGIICTCSKK